ncbi:MAG: sigma-70 family RNA polymerase sigma factor [Chloroflexia bacterium]|nr:sigma-70 family RNA polymerase sigma factor [Chloroflexia bacterium]
MVEPGDDELIAAVARGDPSALVGLYDRFGRLAFGLAYRILEDASLAEETVQDAFMQVWRRADTFDPTRGGNVRAWLLTVVHNRAIDARRRYLDRRPRPVPLENVEAVLSVPDVWREVSIRLTRDEVRAAVDTLPAEQKQAIELAYFEGLTHQEIAQRTEVPLGTIKGRLRLGLKKMHTVLSAPADAHGHDGRAHQGGERGT